jgi:hypothetical protein
MYVANSGDNTVSIISTISQAPPDTVITSVVDGNGAIVQNGGTTFSTAIIFTFTGSAGTNPVAGFECSLDNGGFSACSSLTSLTKLAIGSHTFHVRAVDTAGNKDQLQLPLLGQ